MRHAIYNRASSNGIILWAHQVQAPLKNINISFARKPVTSTRYPASAYRYFFPSFSTESVARPPCCSLSLVEGPSGRPLTFHSRLSPASSTQWMLYLLMSREEKVDPFLIAMEGYFVACCGAVLGHYSWKGPAEGSVCGVGCKTPVSCPKDAA